MSELTAQKIIEIHNEVIEKYGGLNGVLNIGNIEYLIYLLGKENDIFKKASLLMHSIITGHPFMDGNKRTGFQVADLILRQEGIHIHANDVGYFKHLLKLLNINVQLKISKNG